MTKDKAFEIAVEHGWRIIDLSEHGYDVPDGVKQYEFFQYSPAGEDFSFLIEVTDDSEIPEKVREVVNNFDVNDHVKMWIEAQGHMSGVPDAVTLVHDAEEIKNMLVSLYYAMIGVNGKGNLTPRFVPLEEMLQKHFGCSNPFLKRPRIKESFGGRGNNSYEYLTVAGGKAYGKLVDLVYDLGNLLPDLVDANEIVECLDDIVDSPGY